MGPSPTSEPPSDREDLRDPRRLAALKELALLDSPPEEAFDRLTRLASLVTNAPVALVSLVDDHRQFFKSALGLPEPWATCRETPLSHSFCKHVVVHSEPLLISDARQHPLVRDNLAVPDLGVVAYAGIPLILSTGEVLGSFCVIDVKPRDWTPTEVAALKDIAASVVLEIEMRRASARAARLAEAAERAKDERTALLNAVGQGVYGVDREGRCTFINKAALEMIGYDRDEVLGRDMHALIHHALPDGSPYPRDACPLVQSIETGRPVQLENETLWRKDGTFLTAEYSSFPIVSDDVVTGSVVTFFDVAQRRLAQKRLGLQVTVSRILAGSSDSSTALRQVLAAIGSSLDWQVGIFWSLDERRDRLRCAATWASPDVEIEEFLTQTETLSPKPGDGLLGRVWADGAALQIDDIAAESALPRRRAAMRAGLRAAFAFPLKADTTILGVVEFFGHRRQRVDESFLESIATLGQQIAQFLRRRWAEESLRESEAEFRALADNIPQLAWMTRPDGSIYWYNQRWYEYTGSTFEQAQNWGWRNFQHPDHAERTATRFRMAIESGEEWEDTFPLRGRDGTYRWFLSRAIPIRDDAGRIVRWFGTNTDVTEQREAELRAAEAERRLQAALQSGRIGIWSWDFEGDTIEGDENLRDIFGLEAEGTIPVQALFGRIHQDDVANVTARVDQAKRAVGEYDFEFRIVLPSGEVRWAMARGNVAQHPTHLGLHMVGVTWDISERRRTEEALREAEERYRLAARATNDAIWDWDIEADEIRWNEAVGTLFGYREGDLERTGAWWREHIHPEDRDRVLAGMHAVIEGGDNHWSDEYRFLEADGGYANVLDRGFVLRDRSGRPLRMIGAMQDITDRKRYEDELAAAKEAAEAANQAKSQFIANMSHELRTPLTAVIGYCEMLEEEAEELGHESILEDLRKIEGSARHLLSLINDVLDISKIEAGKMELYTEDFEVADLVCEVADTVQALIARKDNELVILHAETDLGRMHSDVVKVRQCLFNLLSNAAKFTEKGRIELSARRERAGGQEQLVFRISDTGIGMTSQQLDKLFQRFSQGDASTTRRFGGTGLGLAITKAFCRMLGGTISVDSAPGKGTTFAIRLPADLRAGRMAARDDAAAGGDAEVSTQETENLVLVIDDDPAMRELLTRFLKRQGFAVRTANDGESGLRCARELWPAAILLDVMMPRMDGWAVLSALKADPELAGIPVIMITIVQEKALGFSLGAADYVTKPIQWGRLKTVLERFHSEAAKGRALVVENDEDLRREFRQILKQEGWEVLEVASGEAALQQVAKSRPGLILADLQLPDMSGFTLLQRLCSTPEWRSIPVIAVTEGEVSPAEREVLRGQVRQIVQTGADAADDVIAELRRIAAESARGRAPQHS